LLRNRTTETDWCLSFCSNAKRFTLRDDDDHPLLSVVALGDSETSGHGDPSAKGQQLMARLLYETGLAPLR
jgi:hypothetical protein